MVEVLPLVYQLLLFWCEMRAGGDIISWLITQQFQENGFAKLSGAGSLAILIMPMWACDPDDCVFDFSHTLIFLFFFFFFLDGIRIENTQSSRLVLQRRVLQRRQNPQTGSVLPKSIRGRSRSLFLSPFNRSDIEINSPALLIFFLSQNADWLTETFTVRSATYMPSLLQRFTKRKPKNFD